MRLFVSTVAIVVGILMLQSGLAAEDKGQNPEPQWSVNMMNVEACSCQQFCSCYFTFSPTPGGHAMHEHGGAEKFCRFTNAFQVNKGNWGDVKLDGAKFWMAGDLGADYSKGMDWAVLHYDPSVTPQQREALSQIIKHMFPVTWKSFTVGKDAPIEISVDKDKAFGRLDGGKMGEVNLKRTAGATDEPIVISNLKFWGVPRNDGLKLMGNELLAYRIGEKPYEFKNTNGFITTLDMNSKDLEKK